MFRPKDDRRMLSYSISTDDLASRLAAALRREFGDLACAVQRIARAMVPPADPRAVRNWWDGRCAPSSAQLLRLGQLSSEVRIELLAILADRQSRSETAMQEVRKRHDDLVQAVVRMQGPPALLAPQRSAAGSAGAAALAARPSGAGNSPAARARHTAARKDSAADGRALT